MYKPSVVKKLNLHYCGEDGMLHHRAKINIYIKKRVVVQVVTPGHRTIKTSVFLKKQTGLISTRLFWDTLWVWAPSCGNTDALLWLQQPSAWFPPPPPPPSLSARLPALFCFSALEETLIWAPLAEEERSRCCLINGGKKLDDSQHKRERASSRLARHRNSFKLC